jgi:hypothetical protein
MRFRLVVPALLTTAALGFCRPAHAQVQTLGPGLRKLSGVEPTSKIEYSRIFLDGTVVPANSPSNAAPLTATSPPVLIAECTLPPSGKPRFELHVHFGDVQDTAYYPPWHSTPDDLYPPETIKAIVTMDFFGYTKVKPAKRQWEYLVAPAGELRYNPPSGRSRNLEEITFYLQYLKGLPTLRLTIQDNAAQFEVNPLFEAIRKEPLCRGAGI